MRRLTLLYGALVVVTLSVACLLIGTIDILIAMACGFGADVYVILLARQKKKMFVGPLCAVVAGGGGAIAVCARFPFLVT